MRSLRALRVLLHIFTGFFLALVTGAFWSSPYRPAVRRVKLWWLGKLVRILRLDVRVFGTPSPQGALYVSNHVSWLDIPVLGSISSVSFLSKAEVADWPLIGRLATVAGTLYIRRGQGEVRQRARQIGKYIDTGRSVLVFPEGTTTDGVDVRAFHAPLFAAVNGGHPVQPVAIRYRGADGKPDRLAPFIGDDEFTEHLWHLLGADRIRVEVHYLPVLSGGAPLLLAQAAQASVRAAVIA